MNEVIIVVALAALLIGVVWHQLASRRPKRAARIPGLPAGVPVRYTNHANKRMRERYVDADQIMAVLAAPERLERDAAERSVRLERDFGDRVLKVWVADSWPPRDEAIIKSTAWKYVARFTIPAESIGRVKGRGGATIRKICSDTGAHISVESSGAVRMSAGHPAALESARHRILALAPAQKPRAGQRFTATVVDLSAQVATVSLPDGGKGTMPIAKLRPLVGGRYIADIREVVALWQQVRVEVDSVRAGRVVVSAVADLQR